MSPLKYQNELMKQYEQSNKDAQAKIYDIIKSGHTITMTGELTGPYTHYTTYFMSNGEAITIISPASLHWLPIPRVV